MRDMMNKLPLKVISLLLLVVVAIAATFYAKQIRAQLSPNSLSGVYGCMIKDDRWGRTPQAGQQYDVSGLVFVIDMTNKKISGLDFRYQFENNNGSLGRITRNQPRIYKDEAIIISETSLMNVFTMDVDGDGAWYLVATNGGNTLLLSGADGANWVSASGVCQKM